MAADSQRTGSVETRSRSSSNVLMQMSAVPTKVLKIYLGPNWGDLSGVGLTGLQLFRAPTAKEVSKDPKLADSGVPVVLQPGQLALHSTTGSELSKSCTKSVSRLLDGRNVTIDPKHMWTFPKNSRVSWAITITITLVTRTELVCGILIVSPQAAFVPPQMFVCRWDCVFGTTIQTWTSHLLVWAA